ncbi:MAG: single-stranded DNA-binding protein [Acidobacteria bacterium]|nr:single-stranded DNA-binding protein [Acidobacteriota bacterium]
MPSLNDLTIIGHVGRDAEMRYLESGKAVASFSIAVSRKYGGQDHTEWFDVQVWEKLADVASKYVRRGSPLMVQGRVELREYTAKDGTPKAQMRVTARNLVLLGTRDAEADSQPSVPAAEPSYPDLPF